MVRIVNTDRVDPWFEAMLRGDFADAWRISDSLLHTMRQQDHTRVPRHEQNIWDGRPVAGKRVLVRCYHGLGDTIQFIRYASLLKRVAAEVIVWMQPSLIPLLREVEGIDRVLPLHDGVPDVEYDVDLELNELLYVFRTTLETIPAEVPYLHVAPALLRRSDELKVGLIWRSGEWDERRSIPFAELRPLSEVSGVEWHLLQRDPRRAGWNGEFGMSTGGDNPLDDARIMCTLDLVISVDTMTAHLAGALARPTWTLLPYDADWRWMRDREDSPWYPTMRLFRQQRKGDWSPIVESLAIELAKTVRLRRRES
ncbi:MAG TPA: hypothetical protein VJ749_18090 [Pyrinomonadaceae bacterium]|nr:hypothetical protein [Pyrinomonadaceae bacterium]